MNNTTGLIASSSLLSGMVIFTDPAYLILSYLGAGLSLLGMLQQLLQVKQRYSFMYGVIQLLKAFIFGGLLTPMYFMAYVHTGGSVISSMLWLDGLQGIFNSFWWLLSLLTAWYSPYVWDYLTFVVRHKVDKKVKNEQ